MKVLPEFKELFSETKEISSKLNSQFIIQDRMAGFIS